MSNPFTIRIFVPEGDPEGVRIIDRLSSTGIFYAFPRTKWESIKNRAEMDYAGVYFLSGYENPEDELPTVYVGQADVIKNRIEQHLKKKEFWDKAVLFVSANKLNSTHAKWLEHALIRRALEAKRSKLDNGNSPQEPNISEAERAEMNVFLEEIYQTLPLVGLRAFEIPKAVTGIAISMESNNKDTIVVPAQKEGFERVFLGESVWYAVRIAGGMLGNIKYIAAYQTAPVSAVTHYAKVERIEPYGEEGKYKLVFSEPAQLLEKPIPFGNTKMGSMQASRYTSFDVLNKAKQVSDLFL